MRNLLEYDYGKWSERISAKFQHHSIIDLSFSNDPLKFCFCSLEHKFSKCSNFEEHRSQSVFCADYEYENKFSQLVGVRQPFKPIFWKIKKGSIVFPFERLFNAEQFWKFDSRSDRNLANCVIANIPALIDCSFQVVLNIYWYQGLE